MKTDQVLNFFRQEDPLLYPFVQSLPLERFQHIAPTSDVSVLFHRLVEDIVGQQLSGKAARAINNKLILTLQTQQVTPQLLLQTEPEVLRGAGLSWAKVRAVLSLAELTQSKKIEWEKLPELSDQDVIDHLVQIKGVGPWTAEMFLLFTLGRPDVFSEKDLGLKKGMQTVYQLANMPTPQEATARAQRWAPYRSIASLALWWSLDKPQEGAE